MDIKIRARLSAYSKIASVEGVSTSLPLPGIDNVGAVLGVGNEGQYTLFPTVKNEQVDEMFLGMDVAQSVEKDEIDTLFKDEEQPVSVTKGAIVSLFEGEEEDTIVEKDDIDELFTEETPTGTVSFSEIDSLFN